MRGMNVSHIEPPKVPESRKGKAELKKPSLYFTESQVDALVELHHYADVFAGAKGALYGGIAPRTKPLLLGGTGSGKTCIARRFAQSRDWDFLSYDCSAWVVAGAYSRPPTLHVLRDYVRAHNRGVILLDELCKLLPAGTAAQQTGYTTSIFGECLAFLDADERLLGHQWSQEDIDKLKTQYFVIGAGAFEFYLRSAREKARGGALGFGARDDKPTSFATYLAETQAIPDEISSRFAAPPIFVGAPTAKDFEALIVQIHDDVGVPLQRPVAELVAEAQSALGGMRWTENYVTRLLVENPDAIHNHASTTGKEKVASVQEPQKQNSFDFFAQDTVEHVRRLNDDLFRANLVFARMTSALAVARLEGKISERLQVYLNDGTPMVDHIFRAICACGLCAEASADDSGSRPLVEWIERSWQGIRDYTPELENAGLLQLWHEGWDVVNRVCQRRSWLSAAVARGRYRT